eukprot:scaffold978_cov172-Ochromonas_danica.AAC.21
MTLCPPGFDCALANSCPNYILPCLDGFYCSSYSNQPHLDDLDYRYALLRTIWDAKSATWDDKEDYVVPDRAVQSMCFGGFYCPNSTTILPCTHDHWCTERTVSPFPCDDLSYCDDTQSAYQINFVNTLIMGILVVIAFTVSILLRQRQLSKDFAARRGDASIKASISATIAAKAEVVAYELAGKNEAEEKERDKSEVKGLLERILTWRKDLCHLRPDRLVLKRGGEGAGGEVVYTVRDYEKNVAWQLDRSALNSYVGYVPQEDILDRQLTVRELLTFNALFRGRTLRSLAEATEEVNRVLSQLAIAHIAESIIGGGENQAANISGGQLKRVNIGCELVALSRPGLLLLDEPTAGLDAAVSYDLIITLEEICKTGVTICLILQQPRKEIFTRIDHLFLMSLLGGIVFEGHSSHAAPYLCSMGYPIKAETSDADFCLDVLNNIVPCQLSSEDGRPRYPPSQLHRYWDAFSADQRTIYLHCVSSNHDDVEHDGVSKPTTLKQPSLKVEKLAVNRSVREQSINFVIQFILNFGRLFIVRIRNTNALLIYMLINVVMACALSSGFSVLIRSTYYGTLAPNLSDALQPYLPSPLAKYSKDNMSSMGLEQLLFFISSALGVSSSLAAVPVFAGFLANAQRERDAGMSMWSYTLGRISADFIFVLLNGFVFTGIWCLFGHAGVYTNWMATILATAFAASSIGYITSALVSKNSASVLAIIVTIAFCVFAGVEPTLKQVSRYPVVDWPWYISFATWTAEATYYTWTRYLTNKGHVDIDIQEGADRYGFVIDEGLGRSIGSLMAIGVGFRMIAALIFYLKSSRRTGL